MAVAAMLAGAGCGEAEHPGGLLAVSGTVQIGGRPVESGSIQFHPTSTLQASGAGATIRDGSFRLAAERGLAPGSYAVEVWPAAPADEPASGMTFDPITGAEVPEAVPPPGSRSGLIPTAMPRGAGPETPAVRIEIEVTPGGPNQFEIEIAG